MQFPASRDPLPKISPSVQGGKRQLEPPFLDRPPWGPFSHLPRSVTIYCRAQSSRHPSAPSGVSLQFRHLTLPYTPPPSPPSWLGGRTPCSSSISAIVSLN